MTQAKQTIPHFRMVADLEVDALIALRKQLCEYPFEGVSLNTLIVKACATALMEVPALNVQWAEGEIHQYHSADIAIVTALPDSISTPIVRNADTKSIWEIGRESKTLAARAAGNSLKMDEVFGGSFGISNLGMYDVEQFDAIINPPQCAMLAIGSAKSKLVLGKDGVASVATIMRVTLSVDHRAIDGATAAAFIRALRTSLEQPEHLNSDSGSGR